MQPPQGATAPSAIGPNGQPLGGPAAPGQNPPTQQQPSQAPLVPSKQSKVTPVAKPAGLDPVVILQVTYLY